MAIVRKEFTFEASHILPEHRGKCSRLHGHSYKVEVFVAGEIEGYASHALQHPTIPSGGMVLDFGEISEAMAPILEYLDHKHLNDLIPFEKGKAFYPPSCENIARYILSRLRDYLGDATPLSTGVHALRVWEGYKTYAQVWADDLEA